MARTYDQEIYRNQTRILAWLWLQDHPIMDKRMLDIQNRCFPDDQWYITFKGLDEACAAVGRS